MDNSKRRPGRPTLPEEDKIQYRIPAKFSHREIELLNAKARKAKLSMYHFSRQAVLNGEIRPRITPEELKIYKDLLTESRNIGVNQNIIAKKALSGLQRDYLSDISSILASYKTLVSTFKQKLL